MLTFPVLASLSSGRELSTQSLWIIFIFVLLLLVAVTILYILSNHRRQREQEDERLRLQLTLEQTRKREKAAEEKLLEEKRRQEEAQNELAIVREQLEFRTAQSEDAAAPAQEEQAEKRRAFLATTAFLVGSDFELVSVIDLESDTFEVFGAEHPGELAAGEISYSEASRSFAQDSCVPEDREKLLWQTSIEGLRSQLKGRDSFEVTADVTEDGQLRRKIMRFTRFNGSETTLLATRRDVTDMMQREARQKSALAAALLQAEDTQEQHSQFLSSMSRSVSTGLSDILILSASAEGEAGDERSKEVFHSIRRSAGAAVSMLDGVLDVLELESGKLSAAADTVSVPDFMAELKTRATVLAKQKKLSYSLKTGGAVPKQLVFDKARCERVLLSLIENAVSFTDEGGSISHTVTYSAPANGKIFIRHSIADTGCGMSADFLEKAASPFTKERPETEGAGVGLYLALHTAEALGGSLDIDSAAGQGTTVTLTLPAAEK